MGSANSNILTTQVTPIVAPPVLTGRPNRPGTIMNLSWTEATGGITAFLLYRNVNESSFVLYQTLGPSVFSYTDQMNQGPIDTQNSYAYYVVAQVGAAVSGPSNEVVYNAGF